MGTDLARYRRELLADPALVERVLAALPAVAETERVVVRVRPEDVDRGIYRALEVAVGGIVARVEL
jgi:hypothetical protein